MAGGLPKKGSEFTKIPGAKIAIISSMWHPQCVQPMVDRAKAELEKLGVSSKDIQCHQAPGSLELPFVARVLYEKYPELDAILAFGVVLKGATTHDVTVLQNVVNGFSQVADRFGKPIINEVIGVVDIKDAEKRSGTDDWNKGMEAAFAVSEFLGWKRTLA